MDDQKQELVKKLAGSNNILVTVSSNPSVDQLSAAIGLTLLLNKMKKHATAVFSGQVPSTIEFLKPADTFEKNTDSLRDFIISLDKSKADKLRYKVEDNVVKIFITPYKTSISQDDLDFSQGDFNVDVVLCLGVDKQQDLDQAITSHGRILHDATVAVIGTQQSTELGSLNWVNPQASSLSELAIDLANSLSKNDIDGQIATSLLTGIVAETERFSNDKTSPTTMQLSAQLMAAGANQQLVASELESPHDSLLQGDAPGASAGPDGTLEIGHAPENDDDSALPPVAAPGPPSDEPDSAGRDFLTSDIPPPSLPEGDGDSPPPEGGDTPASRLILQPPSMGGTLTANSMPENDEGPSVDPLSMLSSSNRGPLLDHDTPATPPSDQPTVALPSVPDEQPVANTTPEPAPTPVEPPAMPTMPEPPAATMDVPPAPAPAPGPVAAEPAPVAVDGVPDFEPLPSEPQEPAPAAGPDPTEGPSLADIEQAVDSPHVAGQNEVTEPSANVDVARDAVADAINAAPQLTPMEPTAAVGATGYLNVQDLPGANDDASMASMPASSGMPPVTPEPTPLQDAAPIAGSPADTPLNMPLPPSGFTIPPADPQPPTSAPADASTAPPVPPPLPFDDLSKFTNPQK
jgi:hypothetical protein